MSPTEGFPSSALLSAHLLDGQSSARGRGHSSRGGANVGGACTGGGYQTGPIGAIRDGCRAGRRRAPVSGESDVLRHCAAAECALRRELLRASFAYRRGGGLFPVASPASTI